jgi:large-conductance mechanosensitive channel
MSTLSIVTESAGRYVHWGVVLISVTNLLIIAAMVVVFVLALVVPFGSGHEQATDKERREP